MESGSRRHYYTSLLQSGNAALFGASWHGTRWCLLVECCCRQWVLWFATTSRTRRISSVIIVLRCLSALRSLRCVLSIFKWWECGALVCPHSLVIQCSFLTCCHWSSSWWAHVAGSCLGTRTWLKWAQWALNQRTNTSRLIKDAPMTSMTSMTWTCCVLRKWHHSSEPSGSKWWSWLKLKWFKGSHLARPLSSASTTGYSSWTSMAMKVYKGMALPSCFRQATT